MITCFTVGGIIFTVKSVRSRVQVPALPDRKIWTSSSFSLSWRNKKISRRKRNSGKSNIEGIFFYATDLELLNPEISQGAGRNTPSSRITRTFTHQTSTTTTRESTTTATSLQCESDLSLSRRVCHRLHRLLRTLLHRRSLLRFLHLRPRLLQRSRATPSLLR